MVVEESKNERLVLFRKFSAYSILGSIFLYIGSIIISGFLKPDYRHLRNYISELGETGYSYSYILNYSLIVTGFFLVLFAYAMHISIKKEKYSIIPFLSLLYFGLSMVAGGVFPCDKGCINPVTFSGYMHIYSGAPLLILNPFAFYLFAKRMENDTLWKIKATFSKRIAFILLILYFLSFLFPNFNLAGLGQRLTVLPIILWLYVMAAHLLRILKK
jgi:hypothetical membrane protein